MLLTFIRGVPIVIPMDLLTFLERFPDQEACIPQLQAVRWPNGASCPKCGSIGNSVKLPRSNYRQCGDCRAQFNVLNGTPLDRGTAEGTRPGPCGRKEKARLAGA